MVKFNRPFLPIAYKGIEKFGVLLGPLYFFVSVELWVAETAFMRYLRQLQESSSLEKVSPQKKPGRNDLSVMEFNTERGEIEGDQQRSALEQRNPISRHQSREQLLHSTQQSYASNQQPLTSYPPETQMMAPTTAGPLYHQHQHPQHQQHLPLQSENSFYSNPSHVHQYSSGHAAHPFSHSQPSGTYNQNYPTQHQQQQAHLYPSTESQPPPPQQQGLAYAQQGNMMMDAQIPSTNQYNNPNMYAQQNLSRPPTERPIVKVTIDLLETYKAINEKYYQERENRRQLAAAQQRQRDLEEQQQHPPDEQKATGVHNNGYDDAEYDYILTNGELFNNRYKILERIGKGSFGQVVSALDIITNTNVAIKIIKSKKPFQVQARTEIELLTHLRERDREDQHNIVRLLSHFMYRNHQCIVFEMLSMNLYDLLKNTQFTGVSLNLIRKFAKSILKALQFLSQPDVDVIHCDLKPENILLRHPKRSGVKVIDFGSSCKSDKRMYFYIQSRFYRSPEVILGLPYSVSIDMWSLGCILVEMHTGDPLFSGSDQVDQMQKIVKVLGMIPGDVLDQVDEKHKVQFFERPSLLSREWVIRRKDKQQERIIPSPDPIASLKSILQTATRKKKTTEKGAPSVNYDIFVDLIYKMLTYDPLERISPDEALQHPFIVAGEYSSSRQGSNGTSATSPHRF